MTTEELLEKLHGDSPVRVIHGANDGLFNLAGMTVASLQASLTDAFNVPEDALAFVNGEQVEPSYRLLPNDTVEFVKQTGEKSILDPDEKAQLDRIEATLARLIGDSGNPKKQVAARKGSLGRKPETLEIAEYANELRLQHKTWKEVLSACKKRWPDDRRVRDIQSAATLYSEVIFRFTVTPPHHGKAN
jgi:hypothetical protein